MNELTISEMKKAVGTLFFILLFSIFAVWVKDNSANDFTPNYSSKESVELNTEAESSRL